MRAGNENDTHYATGDAIIHVVDYLLARRRQLGRAEFLKLVEAFICHQQSRPFKGKLRKRARALFESLVSILQESRYSI